MSEYKKLEVENMDLKIMISDLQTEIRFMNKQLEMYRKAIDDIDSIAHVSKREDMHYDDLMGEAIHGPS